MKNEFYFDKGGFDDALDKLTQTTAKIQTWVDRFHGLCINKKIINDTELQKFLDSPKVFLNDKMLEDVKMNFGAISMNKDRMLSMIDIPNDCQVFEKEVILHNNLGQFLKSTPFNIEYHSRYYSIDDKGKVTLSKTTETEIKDRFTRYITNKKQKAVFDALENIKKELGVICGVTKYLDSKKFMSQAFKSRYDNNNANFIINPDFITKIQ